MRPTGATRWIGPPVLIAAVLCFVSAPPAAAHKPSDSYLSLRPDGARVTVRWDVALRDLDSALGLDVDDDGKLTWGEVRRRQNAIAALLQSSLAIARGGAACEAPSGAAVRHALATHSDGTYAVLEFDYRCRSSATRLDVRYTLFADSDPTHRGIVSVAAMAGSDSGTQGAVLGPHRPLQSFEFDGSTRLPTVLQFAADGVRHIWEGYDHLLFLITLLLPSVFVAGVVGQTHWRSVERLAPALWDVFRIVTAFTVAHSVTLTLAALERIPVSSRLVESAIAATVVLSAANNLWPVLHDRRWMAAFAFGLIHGFGFGQAMKEQALPASGVAWSLLGFNLGVEAGQLAVVAVFVPLAFLLRDTAFYRRGILQGGSVIVALVALVWFAERALDLQLFGT
jgi:hypothetical protein